MRDEQGADAQRDGRRARPRGRADGRQTRAANGNEPAEQGGDSFGLTLGNLTPQIARRLQLPSGSRGAVITDVDPNGPSAGVLRPGDVILSVNGGRVSSARSGPRAAEACSRAASRSILVWRDGGEVFVTVKKE